MATQTGALAPDMQRFQIEYWETASLIDYARNPKKNDHAVDRMAASLKDFGFPIPVLVKSDHTLIDGHLRLKAARKIGLPEVPVIVVDTWTEGQIKAFRILATRSAYWANWDDDLLRAEMMDLSVEFSGDLDRVTGFDLDEIAKWTGQEVVLAPPESPGDPGEERYSEQYAVIVTCTDAGHQERVYNELTQAGYECKVVNT